MSTTLAEAATSRSRRRTVRKSTAPKDEPKVKLGLYVSLDAARRLGITATMDGVDRSAIVDELIRTHLRKYVVQVRGDRGESSVDSGEIRQDVTAA